MSIVLDTSQRDAVDHPADQSLLLLGEAGSGKTTAALHRAAHLSRARAGGFRVLVLTPTAPLAQKCARAAAALRLDAAAHPLDEWLGREARRSFRGLAERDSEHATPGVLRLKRHPAVLAALELLDAEAPGGTRRDDLFELWGDTSLLAEIVEAADGALTDRDAEEVHAHAAVQFAELERDEDGRLVLGLGGAPLHLGTPLHDALTADVEDYPVLFALDRIRGGTARPHRYHHVVLDEAQELAPLELALIGRAVRPGGAVTVVGDAAQQTDPTAWFDGWTATLRALGRPAAERRILAGSHRCPPAVMALARALRDGRPLPAPGDGVWMVSSETAAQADAALAAWASAPLRPGEVAAVIAADRTRARRLFGALPPSLGAKLVLDRDLPRSGLIVTTADRVRGLDLARVAVPELEPEVWPDTQQARAALYVAVTRAAREVWLGATGSTCSRSSRDRC